MITVLIIMLIAMVASALWIEIDATVKINDDKMFTCDGRGYILVNGDMYRLARPWDLSLVAKVGEL